MMASVAIFHLSQVVAIKAHFLICYFTILDNFIRSRALNVESLTWSDELHTI
jgi:hypothetical protein